MEEGYITGPGGLYWTKDVSLSMLTTRFPFLNPGPGSEPLTPSGFPALDKIPNLRAYRCRKCGFISIDSKSQDFGII
jgi:hypothetical protein